MITIIKVYRQDAQKTTECTLFQYFFVPKNEIINIQKVVDHNNIGGNILYKNEPFT